MIFFTCKNGLLLSLLFYRLCAVSIKAKMAAQSQPDIEGLSCDRIQPAGKDNSEGTYTNSQYCDSINSIENDEVI